MMAGAITADDWTPRVWSHEGLMDMQAGLDPVRIVHLADEWRRALHAATAVLEELARDTARLLEETWRGQGSDAALRAVLAYVAASLDGLRSARSVPEKLTDLAVAAGDLRAGLAPPASGESRDAADRRLAEALGQVRALYSGPAVAAGNAVAEIPAPPVPVLADAPSARTWSTGVPSTATAPATMPAGAGPAASLGRSQDDVARGLADGLWPAAVSANSNTVPGPFTSDRPAGMPASLTPDRPAGMPSLTPDRPAGVPSLTPDRPAGVPSLTPDRAAGIHASPAPMPASAPPAPPPAVTAPPATARSSGPVMPLVGGAYPGYAGRDSGAEHRTPGYLISLDNTHELIGPLPKVAPPVIGEWDG